MALTPTTAHDLANTLRAAELAYPGGDLAAHLALAESHVQTVARWVAGVQAQAGAAPGLAGLSAHDLAAATAFVSTAELRRAHAPVVLRDGAGAVLFPQNKVVLAAGYPLFTAAGLQHYARSLKIGPLNALVALRWALTDLLLRLTTVPFPLPLTVVDDHGDVVLAPYARGFAVGSAALYGQSYHYGPPAVNVGFDGVALKALAAGLSAHAGLSYAADVSTIAPFAPYLQLLRRLLAANGVEAGHWLALYRSSDILAAVQALVQRSHRPFGQDPDPSHIGANVDRNTYGYGLMKAISKRDRGAVQRILADFTLPVLPTVPTLTVPPA